MFDILRRKSQPLARTAVDFARELVSIPSVSLDERAVADCVQERMRMLGYDRVLRDDFGNVLGIVWGREEGPTLLLNSHMDTVAADEQDWRHAPLSAHVEDGYLYGRGASDCKAGLAAQVCAGALLKRSLLPLRGNLVVAASVAEENGRSIGVHGLVGQTLPQLGLRADYAILGEPTNLGLYYGHDGWLELDIVVEGEVAERVSHAAEAIFNDMSARSRAIAAAGCHEEIAPRPPRFDVAVNRRRATIQIDHRLDYAEQIAEVLSEVKYNACLAAGTVKEVTVDVAVREEPQRLYTGHTTVVRHVTHAWAIDPFHHLMERSRDLLTAAGLTVRPGKWQLGRLGMGTAGGVLVNEYDVPTIGYGPGCEEQAHAVNECVSLANIAEVVHGSALLAHGLIGVPVFGWTSASV